jgi:hypothetical protein
VSWAIWITGRPGSGKSTPARQVAGAREQAVRWSQLASPGHASLVPAAPEIALDYEYSLRAELTVDTEAQHFWSAAEGVLLLVDGWTPARPPRPGRRRRSKGPSVPAGGDGSRHASTARRGGQVTFTGCGTGTL